MSNIQDKFKNFRSGFVAIVGAPNVGKSTLLNQMMGEKISITSKKPQTTRNRILGVVHRPSSQFIFIDTPGIHKAKRPLNIRIVDTALSALGSVDIVLIMMDVANQDTESETFIVKKLEKIKQPVILVLNKIDLIKKSDLLSIMDKWAKEYPFEAIMPISAILGSQIDELVDAIAAGRVRPRVAQDRVLALQRRQVEAEEPVVQVLGTEDGGGLPAPLGLVHRRGGRVVVAAGDEQADRQDQRDKRDTGGHGAIS
jgi:GTP-binding protein Era